MTRSSSARGRLLLSFGLIFASVAYAVWQNMSSVSSALTTTPSSATPGQSYKDANEALLQTLSQINAIPPSSVPATVSIPSQSMMPAMMPKRMGLYTDGSYTGSAVDAYYGTVQVKAIIQGGKISDVQFLQYPDNRGNSIKINAQAMPLLTQEAITAQSAQVDGVSGATFTSEAFVQSLASALTKAKS